MSNEELYEGLSEFLSERRANLFEEIAKERTNHITVVLEDIYQSQNASAVLRTCDLTGIQNIHVIEKKNKYTLNKHVTLGSSKWIDLNRYESENSLHACVTHLKSKGYRLIATSPKKNDTTSINELDVNKPIALLFGTELDGLSDEAFNLCDERVHVPMYGFTESYNISVCAALVLYTLTERLREQHTGWRLTESEQLQIKIAWARKMLRNAPAIEAALKVK